MASHIHIQANLGFPRGSSGDLLLFMLSLWVWVVMIWGWMLPSLDTVLSLAQYNSADGVYPRYCFSMDNLLLLATPSLKGYIILV